MKYEEIKIGDVFLQHDKKATVISKSDEHKIITTIDENKTPTSWIEEDLHHLEPIKEQLPKEGLLVSQEGSLVYKLSDGSGYGFVFSRQSEYLFNKNWGFATSPNGYWKIATLEQEEKFAQMLKKECEKRGLYEDTKLENHAKVSEGKESLNKGKFYNATTCKESWNKNGLIFYKGNFATPLKETTLELVSKVVQELLNFTQELLNFTIEETESGVIILTPKKNESN